MMNASFRSSLLFALPGWIWVIVMVLLCVPSAGAVSTFGDRCQAIATGESIPLWKKLSMYKIDIDLGLDVTPNAYRSMAEPGTRQSLLLSIQSHVLPVFAGCGNIRKSYLMDGTYDEDAIAGMGEIEYALTTKIKYQHTRPCLDYYPHCQKVMAKVSLYFQEPTPLNLWEIVEGKIGFDWSTLLECDDPGSKFASVKFTGAKYHYRSDGFFSPYSLSKTFATFPSFESVMVVIVLCAVMIAIFRCVLFCLRQFRTQKTKVGAMPSLELMSKDYERVSLSEEKDSFANSSKNEDFHLERLSTLIETFTESGKKAHELAKKAHQSQQWTNKLTQLEYLLKLLKDTDEAEEMLILKGLIQQLQNELFAQQTNN